MQFLSLSWQQLHKDTYKLAKEIEKTNKKFDLIVAIARGGMTIAQILSDFLSLPVATFTISSYKDLRQKKLSEIFFHVGGDVKDKHILLVDDISDTGKTFKRSIEYLHKLGVSSIGTAALLVKPHSSQVPDYFVTKTGDWVVFPYEIKETIMSLASVMKKEKKTRKEIEEKLKTLNISKMYIKTYLK